MIEKVTHYKNMSSGRNFCALAIDESTFTRATGFGKTREGAIDAAEENLRNKFSKKKTTTKRKNVRKRKR